MVERAFTQRQRAKLWVALLLVFVVAFIGLVAGCRPSGSSGTKLPPPIRVGAVLAMTGSGANYGRSLHNGMELAVEDINKAGGINGRKLEILYEDSEGDAKKGVTAFQKLAFVDKVPVVFGSISSVVLALAPLADRQQIVLINSSAISPKISETAGNFLFNLMPSGADESKEIGATLFSRYGRKPIAVLYSNNSSGNGTKDAFVQSYQAAGGKVGPVLSYELNAANFRTQLDTIRTSDVAATYLIAFSSAEFAGILKQAKQLLVSTPWYTYSGFETDETLKLAGAAADGVIYTYPTYTGNPERMQDFQKRYRARYNASADIYTVTSYDGLRFLASALSRVGSDTSSEIRNSLRTEMKYDGVFGRIVLDTKQRAKKTFILKTVRDHSFQPM